ncbi:kelch domain-containing protein [Plasmodium brasilianum]|uniref:Kelch domain-containing protein n=1 Tax=Plasmodium brasilianum TaxID=5824 RepID=A0ACB9YBL3_PLABR|nr:kelch domain-containing protein [Plasmodium brasilianum]
MENQSIAPYEINPEEKGIIEKEHSLNNENSVPSGGKIKEENVVQKRENTVSTQSAPNISIIPSTLNTHITPSTLNSLNAQNVQKAQNLVNTQNVRSVQNAQNDQNVQNIQNVQNDQNVQNAQNIQNIQNTENIENVQNEKNVQHAENAENAQDGKKKDTGKAENEKRSFFNSKPNDEVSKGFPSPPVFHLTEIMHNERCFKRTKGHISVEINGDICIYGGMLQNKCVDNFIRYVPGINLFEKVRLNSNDIMPRAFHSGNVITEDNKNSIVIFGGINEENQIVNETYKFDFQAKKWEHIQNKVNPVPRYKHASCSFSDTVYIHGGLDLNNSLLSDLWVLSGNVWRELSQLDIIPEARCAHSLIFSIYGNARLIFLFGGNKKGFSGALGDTWIFNTSTNRWREVTNTTGPKPCSRWGHAAQLFDNEWMIIYGGITNGWIENYALSDMYALNIYTFSWFEVDISTSKNFSRGYFGSLCLVPYKKSLHVFGGCDESNEYSDVFNMSPLVTYVSYKTLTGKIEQLNSRMNNINDNANDNENISLVEFELQITDLKKEINNINNMMRTFESKFYALEKLNEQCEKLLSKNINSEALEKLEQRIRKLESTNVLMKHDSI